MKKLITRSITGFLYVALILGGIFLGQLYFSIIFLGFTILAIWEFLKLGKHLKIKPEISTTIVAAIILYTTISSYLFEYLDISILIINIPFLALIIIVELYRNRSKSVSNIAYSIFSLVYIVLPLVSLNALYTFNTNQSLNSYSLVLGFFILQWLYDTGAYIFGMMLGKNKLYEKISPKKTWEGLLGGTIVCALAAFAYSVFFSTLGYTHWFTIAFIIVIFGTLGDLIESMFKRSMKVKDSGKLLPGHGGILDRIDSILLSSPMVLSYLIIYFKIIP